MVCVLLLDISIGLVLMSTPFCRYSCNLPLRAASTNPPIVSIIVTSHYYTMHNATWAECTCGVTVIHAEWIQLPHMHTEYEC